MSIALKQGGHTSKLVRGAIESWASFRCRPDGRKEKMHVQKDGEKLQSVNGLGTMQWADPSSLPDLSFLFWGLRMPTTEYSDNIRQVDKVVAEACRLCWVLKWTVRKPRASPDCILVGSVASLCS